jgi:ABC-type transport system involved in cytochrome c biogenesis permease subunit
VFHRLPSLEALDELMRELVGAGFLALTVSIVLGFVLARLNDWGWGWLADPKIVATLVTWVVYAVLFHLRAAQHRHGRKMAIVALVGLACVLFSFLGVHWVSDSVHNFVTSAASTR